MRGRSPRPDVRRTLRGRLVASWSERMPPEPFRRLEVALLLRVFSHAFMVEPPRLAGLDADRALAVFREFTAALSELAAEREGLAPRLRSRLRRDSLRLGTLVRRLLGLGTDEALAVARLLYRGIRIELAGGDGGLVFGPCSFAARYGPVTCRVMSGFDEGFLAGISGLPSARLVFSCRLSEGAPCCRARLV